MLSKEEKNEFAKPFKDLVVALPLHEEVEEREGRKEAIGEKKIVASSSPLPPFFLLWAKDISDTYMGERYIGGKRRGGNR